jgi:cystathionine beta-lyase/cystathionine gamma-synthase
VFALQDIPAVVALARERGIVTAIDNSWASPYFQNPAEMGVDLVLHSATKYLGGHSDILAGVVAGRSDRILRIARDEGALLGAALDPFASWLMIRGLRTLALRMERHQASAIKVAEHLARHPSVAQVYYPGHSSHPQHELAKRQLRGFSGLLSFVLKEGSQSRSYSFVNRLRYFGIGVSWGGFESLAIPISFPKDPFALGARNEASADWGARLHIGLETVDDLLDDLNQALSVL